MKSNAIPQGTYQPDPLSAMHNSKPATTQNPQATMRVMETIFNPPDCNCASVSPAQAARDKMP